MISFARLDGFAGMLFTCLALLALPARGELLSYESADYPGTASINGLNQGLGWSGAWSGNNNVSTRSLSFPGLITGGWAFSTDGNNTPSFRGFATTAHPTLVTADGKFGREGTTLWFSFLIERNNTTATGTFAGLSLWNDNTRVAYFGALRDSAFWGASIDSLGSALTSTVPVVNFVTTFMVVKFTFGVAGTNDRLDVYINPAPGTEPSAPVLSTDGFNLRFNRLLINSGDTATVTHFDEIRLATTYGEVAPAIPPNPPAPEVRWARATGGDWPHMPLNGEGPVSAVVPAPGNGVVVGGGLRYQARLGADSVEGDNDGYVVRLENDGSTAVWSRFVASADPGLTSDGIVDVATDAQGNLYLAGQANQPPAFGIPSITEQNFLAKLTPAGQPLWGVSMSRRMIAPGITCIAVDASGNVYAGGYTGSDLVDNSSVDYTFGGITVRGLRGWIAKLSPAGDFIWVRGAGDRVHSLAVDPLGQVVAVGDFVRTKLFGTESLTSSDPNFWDAFAVKLDADGNFLWRKVGVRANANEAAQEVALDAAGNAFVALDFTTGGTFAGATLPTSGTRQMLVAKLDPNGTVLWTTATTAPFNGNVADLLVDPSGNVYLGGTLHAPRFGPYSLPTPAPGPFIARLNPEGAPEWFFVASNAEANAVITSLALAEDGDVLFGGNYETAMQLGAYQLPAPSSSKLVAPVWGFAGRLGTGGVQLPLSITNVEIVNGMIRFLVSGPANASVKIESSADLGSWEPVIDLTLGVTPAVVEAPLDTAVQRRYFRARPQR